MRSPVLAILLLAALSACARTGDLGRAERSTWTTLGLSAGSVAAEVRGEPVSRFRLTDEEAELRERAWRFLMPAHDRLGFETAFASLVQTRILPRPSRGDPTAYAASLLGEAAVSPASRYRRIAADAAADRALFPAFRGTVGRVEAADRVRLRSLSFVRSLEDREVQNALARVAENRCLVAWVRHEAVQRAAAYRHALERLVIEAPQGEAIDAERAVAALEAELPPLDPSGVGPEEAACAVLTDAPGGGPGVRIVVK